MEKELSRFEIAIVKRTAQNTKALRTKRDKAKARIEALTAELQEIEAVIEKFEAPVKEITGGLSSEEVLAELNRKETTEETTEDCAPEVEPACECEPESANVAEGLEASVSE